MTNLKKAVLGYSKIIAVSLLFAVTLTSCFSPWTGEEKLGSVTVTIGGNNAGRVAIGWETPPNQTDSDDLWHRITMIDSSGLIAAEQDMLPVNEGGGSTTFTSLADGAYTVMASGWLSTVNDTSDPLTQLKSAGRGSVTVTNRSGNTTVTMRHSDQPTPVTFLDAKDSLDVVSVQYIIPGERAVSITPPERNGFTFDGWFKDSDDSEWDFGNTLNEDPVLYAKWEATGAGTPNPPGTPVTNPTDAGLYESLDLTANTWTNVTPSGGTSHVTNAFNHFDIAGNEGKVYLLIVGADEEVGTRTLDADTTLTIRAAGTGTPLTTRTITLSGFDSLFKVEDSAELTLDAGITLVGRAGNNAALVSVTGAGSTLTMKDAAVIKGNESTSASTGTYIPGISGNGGGVYVYNGTFRMEGGTISGNSASDYGGGVYVDNGYFTMSDTSKITGATGITSAYDGGGVYVKGGGTFDMSGGTISGHTVGQSGGGVFVGTEGTFEMTGGTISGNEVTAIDGYGGGVYVDAENAANAGTFTKEGASSIIYGNGILDPENFANRNTAYSGPAVYVSLQVAPLYRLRNDTAGGGINLNSNGGPNWQ